MDSRATQWGLGTKYQYCRYLQVWVSIDTATKYRLFSILSLRCLWLACMHEDVKKISIKAKKLENANFVQEVRLKELDQDKIINCVSDRILHSCPKPFGNVIVSQ